MHIQKQYKIFLYLNGYYHIIFSNYKDYEKKKKKLFTKLTDSEIELCYQRKDYYNKERHSFKNIIDETTTINKIIKNIKSPKAYYFDFFEYARFFNKNSVVRCIFEDVNYMPEKPSIVKSRPIYGTPQNGILMNLDKQRHFRFIKNDIPYKDKKNILFGRMIVCQKHRENFFKKHFTTHNVDIGQVNQNENPPIWYKKKETIKKHLENKFILSLEGNDVATNLKWIMSSNSVAVATKPKFETWYMEGKLEANKHYLEIKDDYSDLEEKLEWLIENPNIAKDIVKEANNYVKKFQNKNIEDLTSILVLESLFCD